MMIDRADRITSFVSERWADVTEVEGLGSLIRAHGIDLGATGANPASIARGTPVYACEDAEPSRVLRRMAEVHVRYLFVVGSARVVGVVDIRELIERAAAQAWPDDSRNGMLRAPSDSLP
jgi:CBS domain-containing protein